MRIRIFSYLIFITIFIAIYGLFTIKDEVSTLSYQLSQVSKQIVREQDTIHILKVELAYLASPTRLSKLSSSYLKLESIKTSQMIRDPLVSKGEENEKITTETANANFVKRNINWRYKKAPSKYVKTVSEQR